MTEDSSDPNSANKELRVFSHKHAPSDCIPQSVQAAFKDVLYDVFLIHAGEQKESADTMKNLLEAGKLRCFLDQDMICGSPPTESMRAALQTCRYAVVILSKSLVLKKHPCAELQYAWDRLMWMRQNCQAWNSLKVILYDLSVDEYETLRTKSQYVPPSLSRDVTMKEWPGQRITSWWQECLELKVSLIEEDLNNSAVEKWQAFLTQISQSDLDGFPSVSALYS